MANVTTAHIDNICDFNQVNDFIAAHDVQVEMQHEGSFMSGLVEVVLNDNCAVFWFGDPEKYNGIFAEINPETNSLMMTCVYDTEFWHNTHSVANADELANMLEFYGEAFPNLANMYMIHY